HAMRKVVEELEDVMAEGVVDPARIGDLRYLDAAIKETLRLTPIVPAVGRTLEEPMRIGGMDLPAGVTLAPCIYLTHHRPDLWPNAEPFDPDRFLDKKVTPFIFFPFGGGIRRCIGMAFALYEMKIVLATVLLQLKLRLPLTSRTKIARRGIIFAPSDGVPVIV